MTTGRDEDRPSDPSKSLRALRFMGSNRAGIFLVLYEGKEGAVLPFLFALS